ncbi:MAG: SRPBCC family protein [Ornithinimicrobium sp.]
MATFTGRGSVPARSLVVLGLAGGTAYLAVVGARLRTWGARGDEATRVLPSEALMPQRGAALTHAITIEAGPEMVWPWIAQLGQDKGGFYSYAWIENLGGAGITNADHIVPQWQDPQPGGHLRLHPTFALDIVRVVPGELFVAARPVSRGLGFQWIFLLTPEGQGRTRLLVRERYVVPWAPARLLAAVLTCGSAVMSRRMVLGIKERAEAASGH